MKNYTEEGRINIKEELGCEEPLCRRMVGSKEPREKEIKRKKVRNCRLFLCFLWVSANIKDVFAYVHLRRTKIDEGSKVT
jgi:hypothetical protein